MKRDKPNYLQQTTASSRGDVTARISSLHSLTAYATAMRTQFPKATSKLVIIPHKVLRSILTHSTSAERFPKVTCELWLLVSIERRVCCTLTQNYGNNADSCQRQPREKSHGHKHHVRRGEGAQDGEKYGSQIRHQEQRPAAISGRDQCTTYKGRCSGGRAKVHATLS